MFGKDFLSLDKIDRETAEKQRAGLLLTGIVAGAGMVAVFVLEVIGAIAEADETETESDEVAE
jgi:hypothetical protein